MNLRNVAIIAHVDHGKTTLVDRLLQQSGTYRENQRVVERAMDSNDLERERGITILAKAASVQWKDTRINIVDTPGHADFGGEVERILNMVDGALVLVDAAEGPLPQTKFVVSKALKVGLKPIVVINKVDRSDARPTEVINEVFDLFAALDASEEQLDFPILYGSAKQGWMAERPEGPKDEGMQPLFDLILRHVSPPTVEDGPFRMIGTILEANPYLGRIITGRITSGSIKPNQAVKVLDADGKVIEQGRLTKILAFRGIERTPLEEAEAGDIIAIAGLTKGTVADTFCDPSVDTPLKAQPIDPPTVAMSFIVNNSPLAGTEGDKVTSRMIRDRLLREAEGNVALRVKRPPDFWAGSRLVLFLRCYSCICGSHLGISCRMRSGRFDFPIVREDMSLPQNRFGAVVEVDRNRGKIERDRIQNSSAKCSTGELRTPSRARPRPTETQFDRFPAALALRATSYELCSGRG